MARIAQLSFEQRLARIEQKVVAGDKVGPNGVRRRSAGKKRRVYWGMLSIGAMAGGLVGKLFAMRLGLTAMVSLDLATLYEMMVTDYVAAGLITGVAIAPLGFVMSQVLGRSSSRSWQFWIGYFAAVLGSNSDDIQALYAMLTGAAG